ncbi:MAG: hypothetical protein KGO05_14965, partial [Chloroflexota bacterium]|nr:hypothetical protein [Chloroflexota bacterium]
MPRTRSLPRSLRVGLIGHPVDHSRSPAMQQAAFDALRLDIRYELWDTVASDLRKRIESLRQPGFLGANVTIPHKIAALSHLDSRSASARWLAGAVNTIVREETPAGDVRLVGHNTDTTALLRILDEQQVWRPDLRALVLGAGGAAQAALGVILLRGGQPWVAARKRSAARQALEALYARRDESSGEVSSGASGAFPTVSVATPDRMKDYAL